MKPQRHAETFPAQGQGDRTPSERDAQQRVVAALQQRGFTAHQDVAVPGAGRKSAGIGIGRADIYAERGDTRLIVEMKRPDKFRTEGQRGKARGQAQRYADRLGPLFVATSDGDTLVLEHGGERYVHQLVSGPLLEPDDRPSPLDLGADYAAFLRFRAVNASGTFPKLTRRSTANLSSIFRRSLGHPTATHCSSRAKRVPERRHTPGSWR